MNIPPIIPIEYGASCPFISHQYLIHMKSHSYQSNSLNILSIHNINWYPINIPFTWNPLNMKSGWWFGTFFIFPYVGNNHPNWLIFFRGVETINQKLIYYPKLSPSNSYRHPIHFTFLWREVILNGTQKNVEIPFPHSYWLISRIVSYNLGFFNGLSRGNVHLQLGGTNPLTGK